MTARQQRRFSSWRQGIYALLLAAAFTLLGSYTAAHASQHGTVTDGRAPAAAASSRANPSKTPHPPHEARGAASQSRENNRTRKQDKPAPPAKNTTQPSKTKPSTTTTKPKSATAKSAAWHAERARIAQTAWHAERARIAKTKPAEPPVSKRSSIPRPSNMSPWVAAGSGAAFTGVTKASTYKGAHRNGETNKNYRSKEAVDRRIEQEHGKHRPSRNLPKQQSAGSQSKQRPARSQVRSHARGSLDSFRRNIANARQVQRAYVKKTTPRTNAFRASTKVLGRSALVFTVATGGLSQWQADENRDIPTWQKAGRSTLRGGVDLAAASAGAAGGAFLCSATGVGIAVAPVCAAAGATVVTLLADTGVDWILNGKPSAVHTMENHARSAVNFGKSAFKRLW